jgi:hypothetical protein
LGSFGKKQVFLNHGFTQINTDKPAELNRWLNRIGGKKLYWL